MKLLEREPGVRYIADAADVGRLIEDCISSGSRAALLHADNLPRKFFDLSSGQAGQILQKLRTYRVRLAVVAAKRSVRAVRDARRGGRLAGDGRARSHPRLIDRQSHQPTLSPAAESATLA